MARILVADDEPKLGRPLADVLEAEGHAVVFAEGGRRALEAIAAERFDVVLTDLRMPEVDGLAVLQAARAAVPPSEVLLMTAFGTAASAVAAMKSGAADYLFKPFPADELRLRVRRLLERVAADEKLRRLQEKLTPRLVAHTPAMEKALRSADLVAKSDATVLLLGETGTGKSHLARYLHYTSGRAAGPLIEVHCSALPEALLESELFGHEKGAFTGAHERKAGLLAAADGGTLFLDEIGEMTNAVQIKLLRFLQEREFTPLGSSQARKVNVRVIAATNRDLAAGVRAGAFREDFYYRLNVFSIDMPPLRERRADVLPLADAFLAKKGVPPSKLSPAARAVLEQRSFPGNVRELENALERALILAGADDLDAIHVALAEPRPQPSRAQDVLGAGFNFDDFQRELIFAAIERAGGNKAQAARLLGVTRRRLYSLMHSLGAPEPEPPEPGAE